MSTSGAKVLSIDSINAEARAAKYAVRGELVIRAMAHQAAIEKGNHNLPFEELVYCNIGNPQQLQQKPITFFRQVLAACECPSLIDSDALPADARARAKHILSSVGSTGAYSQSQGIGQVTKNVAAFIEARDGFPANPANVYLTDGASVAVQRLLRLMIRNEKDGIMIPTPQYPLYSASIQLYGGAQVGYYLNEEKGWSLEVKELEIAHKDAVSKGITPRGLVIINPGNPTGQILDRKNMEEVVEFCHKNKLVLMADEVYQENVYSDSKPFISFKKVLREMDPKYQNLELASFHSASKGFIGECGKRGGYVEMLNFDPLVVDEVYKLASVGLCPNVVGQLAIDLMVKPPSKGDQSYDLYVKERDAILQSLKRRAVMLSEALNKLEGVSCNAPEGAMYAFPQIRLPSKFVAEAKASGKAPDALYCVALLDNTGICVVPGSGFGQREGTYHFRTTFLPSEEKIKNVTERMAKFHAEFMNKHR